MATRLSKLNPKDIDYIICRIIANVIQIVIYFDNNYFPNNVFSKTFDAFGSQQYEYDNLYKMIIDGDLSYSISNLQSDDNYLRLVSWFIVYKGLHKSEIIKNRIREITLERKILLSACS